MRRCSIFQEPTKLGGRAIKKMEVVKKALVGKLVWRLLNESDSLWTQVLKANYIKEGEFWDCKRIGRCSSTWNAMINVKELVAQNIWRKVGDGSSIDI